MAQNQQPVFPQVNSETLTQAIKTFVTARQNVSALANGASLNYDEVVRGWADAIAAIHNPSLAYFDAQEQLLFSLVGNQNQQQSGIPTLLFNTLGPVAIGQWVYQVSTDTVSVADFSSISTGPAVGVVSSLPTPTTARVQTVANFVYGVLPLPFLPLVPDTLYYIGSAGGILSAVPNPPSGGYVQEIGFAKSATELVLNIQEPTVV